MLFLNLGPLVSVGVPTRNRPETLERTLESLINQTYRNIEIVVSDNASTDPKVQEVIDDYCMRDSRVKPFRQSINGGAFYNFEFVLKKSSSEYFMWLADDDYLAPWFLERCVHQLEINQTVALSTCEVQYFSYDGRSMPLVQQGRAFRCVTNYGRHDRMRHLIQNNFDNLVYGLFRKKALIHGGEIFWGKSTQYSSNEIPMLLLAAMHGEIIVQPEPGIFKYATPQVRDRAEWEVKGGFMPTDGRISGFKSALETWKYHINVIRAIRTAVDSLPLSNWEKDNLIALARKLIKLHFVHMLVCYKPRLPYDTCQ